MVFPLGPMMSPILDCGIWIVMIRGAYLDSCERVCGMAASMMSRMWSRAFLAFSSACDDPEIQAVDLDVHLNGRHAGPRTRDLEVHVAEVVFGAQDVGEHRDALPFLDQAHRHARAGARHGHAGVEQGE